MSRLQFIFESEVLQEISLEDHFKQFKGKFQFTDNQFRDYKVIAQADPTSNNGEIKGKYTEWLLKNISVKDIDTYEVPKMLKDLSKVKGFDINKYKSIEDLFKYYESLDEEDFLTGKEKKKKEKDIFNDPKNVKVIYKDNEYFIGQPLTHEGSIKLARYKTSESAKWCTADPESCKHFDSYVGEGELYSVIPLDEPEDKFHVHISKGKVKELRDFDDDDYMEQGLDILNDLADKDENLTKKMGVESFELADESILVIPDEIVFKHFLMNEYVYYMDYFEGRTPDDTNFEVKFEDDFDFLEGIRAIYEAYFNTDDIDVCDTGMELLVNHARENDKLSELDIIIEDVIIEENDRLIEDLREFLREEDITEDEFETTEDYFKAFTNYLKDNSGLIDKLDNPTYIMVRRYRMSTGKETLELHIEKDIKDIFEELTDLTLESIRSWKKLL